MEAAAYEEMRALEDRHWWFRGRRRRLAPLVAEALERCGSRAPLFAEIGCGTGGNLAHLALGPAAAGAAPARWLGIDLDGAALGHCRERALASPLVRADAGHLPLRDGTLDGLLAFDLIEHVEDDVALLREFRRVLRPGGQLVASVPLHPELWSPHDDFLHHRRRYRPGELETKCEAAGLRVTRRSGFNFLLLPPIALVRRLKALRSRRSPERAPASDFFELPGPLNDALAGLFALEGWLAERFPVTAGISLLVRAERAPASSPAAGPCP